MENSEKDGNPRHLTCLLRNLYAGQEGTERTEHGITDWLQIRKGVHQGCILSPSLLNFYAEYIMRNTGLEEAQAGIKIARRVKVKVVQLCLTHCDPMDCTPHGILQAIILEWVAFPFSRGSSQPRNRTRGSCLSSIFFTH